MKDTKFMKRGVFVEKNKINIVMGILRNENCNRLQNNFKKFLNGKFVNEELGVIDYVYSKADFELSLSSMKYNMGIIMEKLGNEAIGQGALRKWRKEYPDCRILLLMDDNRKGSAKANGLYEREYYDGFFMNDFGKKIMLDLMVKSRTKEEAYLYYEVENYRRIEVEKIAQREEEKKERSGVDKTNSSSSIFDSYGENNSSVYMPSRLNLVEIHLEEEISEANLKDNIISETRNISISGKDIKLMDEEENEENNNIDTEEILSNKDSKQELRHNEIQIHQEELTKEENHLKAESKRKDIEIRAKKGRQIKSTNNETNKNVKEKYMLVWDKLDDEEYLNNFISQTIMKGENYNKEIQEYELITNKAFIAALEEFEFRSEEALNEVLKEGKVSFKNFLKIRFGLGDVLKESDAKPSEKSAAQDMFYDFCFEYDILNKLINDKNVTDIHVVSYDTIRVKKFGERKNAFCSFYDEKHYKRFIKNLIVRNNNFTSNGLYKTYVDKEYSSDYILSVTIIEESVSNTGTPELWISKGEQNKISFKDMIGIKFSLKEAAIILNAIYQRKGILLCGPKGCGATTMLNAMLEYIPKERNAIVLQHKNELFVNNHPEITIWHPILKNDTMQSKKLEDLCEIAIQLDKDYFILDNTKGKESYSLYKAIIYGYTPWTSVKAYSCENALDNLVNMVIDAHPTLERSSIKDLIVAKFELIIYMEEKKVKEIVYK